MLYTILQIIAFQALFLVVYDLFLKRETFFNYNRVYLLITSLLALILPFVKFSELKSVTTKDFVIHLPQVFIGEKGPTDYEILVAEQAGIIMEQPQLPLWQSLALAGIVMATLIFLFKIIKLYNLRQKNPKHWQGDVLIVKLIKSSAAFSFFNTIFMGERIPECEKSLIYKHELVHIKEFHTLDLLFFEILRIVFWFNPLVYIYQSRIKELHEYTADAKAVKQNGKVDYYQSLLNQVFDVNTVSFTNTFFKKSLIKKRIAMLQKTKSKQLNLIKYVLLVPLVFGMLIYTSTEVRAQQKAESKKGINQELTDDELVKKYYDEYVAMEKNGATGLEIAEHSELGEKSLENYIVSKRAYLKSKAFMAYIADGMLERKSKKNILTQEVRDTAKRMKSLFQSYDDYRAFKKTDEAKNLWETNTGDGNLKLVVDDVANLTNDEQLRFEGLKKQLTDNSDFKKLIVSDGINSMIIKSPDSMFKVVFETEEVPFAEIDEAPTLLECKDELDNELRKSCLSEFVDKHLNENFNTKIADSLNPGRKRIFVQFKIDTEGKISNVLARGPGPELEEEAKRVIKTLPQFVPGRQNGELVIVPYTMPIVFEVKDSKKD